MAFSWPSPTIDKYSYDVNYLIESPKFALLSGDVSELSDANGIAVFKNLTIEFMTNPAVYIYFSCDNLRTKIWERKDITDYISLSIPKLVYPLNFLDTNDYIKIQLCKYKILIFNK